LRQIRLKTEKSNFEKLHGPILDELTPKINAYINWIGRVADTKQPTTDNDRSTTAL